MSFPDYGFRIRSWIMLRAAGVSSGPTGLIERGRLSQGRPAYAERVTTASKPAGRILVDRERGA
jgi:hypothetical protein